jgi:hypothetical protein
MSLCTKYLNFSLRLTSVTLTAALVGCSSSPSPSNYEPQTSSTTQSQSIAPEASSVPAVYEPRLERINEPVPLAEGHPNEYVVQVGDTLWDISAAFLRDPWFWPEIWYVNPDIENPHLIYPGDVLGLVYIEGRTRITNVRTSTYRMSPEARATPLSEAVMSIPFEKVAAFLKAGVILEKSQADDLPYLLQTRGNHMMASAGNEVYVRGTADDPLGTSYTVITVGEELRDPDDNQLIGFHSKKIGLAVLRRTGDPATIALIKTTQEANMGDRLLPEVIKVPLNFFPRAPSTEIDGRIIAVDGAVSQIAQYQVVVVNRGTDHGLSVGDVLSIFQSGEVIDDQFGGGKVTLPDEDEGTLMIFKTYDRISYGLVMEARDAIHLFDAVRNPT